MSELFGGIYERGPVADAVGDRSWLQAMLDVEAALGGDILKAEDFNLQQVGEEAAQHASPAVPVASNFPDSHAGATSQDILDTAMMLIVDRSRTLLLGDARAASNAAARLAEAHRHLPTIGRTLLEDAVPTSFGLRAAGWMVAIDDAATALASAPVAVQMGGPVGHRDPAVASEVALRLQLEEPLIPWHTNRLRAVDIAARLGALAGVFGKVARDVTLSPGLREGVEDRGRSSSMPHKRNPVAAVSVLACARRTPALVATMFAAMEQEQERAAGAWQAEWGTITDLLLLTGSATAWGRDLLENLIVDPAVISAGTESADLGSSDELIDRALSAHNE